MKGAFVWKNSQQKNVLSENAILEILKTYFEGVGDLCEDMLRANVEKASAGGFSEEDRSIPVEMAVYILEHFAVIYSALIHNEGIRDIFVEAINIEQMLDEVDEASAEKIRNKLCGPRDQEGEEEYVVINLGIYDDDIYRMISRIIENSFIRYKRIASDKETVYACKKLSDKDREDIGFCICNFMYLIRAFAKQQSFSDKVHVIMHDMDKAVSEWETNPEISLFDNTAVNTGCIDEDHEKNEGLKGTVDLGNPRAIYEYLLSRVYKQDDYCRDAAMILYNHINGMTSTNIVCGPSGSGKTYVWECLREIYPKIIIVNSATLTKDGWTGGNKVTSFLNQVDPEDPECIIVFDEFDKCAAPQYCAGGNNVSASIQSEFLKMVEGEVLPGKGIGIFETLIDTSDMSFVL